MQFLNVITVAALFAATSYAGMNAEALKADVVKIKDLATDDKVKKPFEALHKLCNDDKFHPIYSKLHDKGALDALQAIGDASKYIKGKKAEDKLADSDPAVAAFTALKTAAATDDAEDHAHRDAATKLVVAAVEAFNAHKTEENKKKFDYKGDLLAKDLVGALAKAVEKVAAPDGEEKTWVENFKKANKFEDSTDDGEKDGEWKTWQIGLIVVGIVVVLGGIGAAVYFLLIRKKPTQ